MFYFDITRKFTKFESKLKFLKLFLINMTNHKLFTLLSTVVLFLLFCSQAAGQRATRQSAQEAFNKDDYKKAYSEFTELLEVYTRDPLYKYYASVCLINLEQEPEQAETLIKEAIENNSAARSIPSDATFYLARALHLNGKFDEATGVYQRFANQAGRRTAREFRVQDYIQQCTRGEGAITRQEIAPAPDEPEEITNFAAIPIFTTPEVRTIPEPEPLPDDYAGVLDKALNLQFLADSVKRANATQRNTENERLAASYQASADEMFSAAYALINPKTEESVMQTEANKIVEEINIPQINVEEIFVQEPIVTQNIYYYFKVFDAPSSEAIQIDPKIPEGLNYRIQMAVFRNPVSPVFFKGITPVYGITNANNPELKTYYAGMFRRIADARTALTEVKNRGFNDSFIVYFLGDRAVSADRAAALEQEWGTKPFESIVDNKPPQVIADKPVTVAVDKPIQVAVDTLLPTLVFRVEVMRVARAITPAAVESLQTIAGVRGLDIITTDDKRIAYIIGNFITYASAAEYADLLVRNGYRDTRVIAWLGNREIPLETAKQLFESLE